MTPCGKRLAGITREYLTISREVIETGGALRQGVEGVSSYVVHDPVLHCSTPGKAASYSKVSPCLNDKHNTHTSRWYSIVNIKQPQRHRGAINRHKSLLVFPTATADQNKLFQAKTNVQSNISVLGVMPSVEIISRMGADVPDLEL